jgi:hypothetical protein
LIHKPRVNHKITGFDTFVCFYSASIATHVHSIFGSWIQSHGRELCILTTFLQHYITEHNHAHFYTKHEFVSYVVICTTQSRSILFWSHSVVRHKIVFRVNRPQTVVSSPADTPLSFTASGRLFDCSGSRCQFYQPPFRPKSLRTNF